MSWLSDLFKSKWGPYSFLREETVKERIYKNRYDILEFNDPMDIAVVPTDKFCDVTYEVWVRYNLKTGLPDYHRIRK